MWTLHREAQVISTRGRGPHELTEALHGSVRDSGVLRGSVEAFVHHTSASLTICENADPDVLRDLEAFLARLVPDGDPLFRHTAEGPDDMPAHVRSVLTTPSLSIPVEDGRPALGTWQGLFLLEHRTAPHRRRVTFTVIGERR
ncbi:MAG: secondary thiamine-phosphate synthase enzyme YjbQ [Planctomycetota bacterium]